MNNKMYNPVNYEGGGDSQEELMHQHSYKDDSLPTDQNLDTFIPPSSQGAYQLNFNRSTTSQSIGAGQRITYNNRI